MVTVQKVPIILLSWGVCVCAFLTQVAELVKELRCELDQLLQDKIKNPSMDLCTCPRGSRIISMIVKLVTTQ